MTQPSENAMPAGVETLLLDMDGTILDLAYDNYMWFDRVPAAYALANGLSEVHARERLSGWFSEKRGTLDWYCLSHWSDRLGMDVVALHGDHRERIGYLPGAREFLASFAALPQRLVLVTNSHPSTLLLKQEATGLCDFFDAVYSAHEIGFAKEQQGFWEAVTERESLDPGRSMLVDDTPSVLSSGESFGLRWLREISRPDTQQPLKASGRFKTLESLADLGVG